jgi:hypothetical protein
MKKLLALSASFMLSVGMLFAETSTLINFNDLVDDGDGQNTATVINFGEFAGASFSDEDKAAMRTSLFINNWNVRLNSSANNRTTQALSQVRAVQSNFLNGNTTMGVRVFFPETPFNANATILPPFDIPTMAEIPGQDAAAAAANTSLFRPTQFDGKGVIKNVGNIKSVSVNIRGLNYPHRLSVLIADFNNKQTELPLGDLRFDGWKTLTWNNPNYIYEARNRELAIAPLYPYSIPLVKFSGFRIYKDGSEAGADFIGNIADVTVTYDKAVRDDVEVDVDDETLWQILKAREATRRDQEMRNFAERQILEFVENKLMVDSNAPFAADGNVPVNSRTSTAAPAAGG